VVIQDAESDAVLMVAFVNEEALARTRETGRTHFWSRSRGKLWKKGETSGHEQIVDGIFVNCELNSLLIRVRQVGAACHDGFPTCYYRELESDNALSIVQDRWFDPADVYDGDGIPIETRTARWYGAYEYLSDHDLSAESGTSRRLRDPGADLDGRVADELRELAGVLTGEHRHGDLATDALLEGSQVLYWLALVAVRAGVTWGELRPDRALVTAEADLDPGVAAGLLRAEAAHWSAHAQVPGPLAARCHAAMALVAQAVRSVQVPPITLVKKDLADLESRPYLADFFTQ
jgi:phosphoribosyl-AMP cyclohydrolase